MQTDAPVCCLDQVGLPHFLQRSSADLKYTIIAFHKGRICTGCGRVARPPQAAVQEAAKLMLSMKKYIISCAQQIFNHLTKYKGTGGIIAILSQ